jgi:head-tail adaptor
MIGFLTPADRADMLASLTASWTQLATIQRNPGDDTWYTIASNVPCRATASSASEVIVAGELRSVIPWRINMPTGTDVSTRDRIIIANRTFQVEGVVDPLDAALIRQVQAIEVGGF